MRISKRLAIILVAAGLAAGTAANLEARTKKGDKLAAQGRQFELRKEWEKALEFYEQALAEDPGDAMYQMTSRRTRFEASQARVDQGHKLRAEGKLEEALAEFEKAYAIDPSSPIAEQELRNTVEMAERERKRREEGKPELAPAERAMTPGDLARKEAEEKRSSVRALPTLKPFSPAPITLKMNNQPPKVLFETVGKLAGINVLFDPEYANQAQARPMNVEISNATLEEALDYLALMTKSFWKPLSPNAVFVTVDNQNKRQEYEEHVMRVFYLTNVTAQQELQEISTTIRSVANVQRVFVFNAQNAIIVRGTADQVALAEMMIHNLDKPRAEVVVDVIVMEANRSRTRNLTLAPTTGSTPGINIPFTPKATTSTGTGTGTGSTTTTSSAISAGRIGRVSIHDYTVTLPGANLQALMSDRGTRVLQSPQLRTVDGQKASLKIGDRQPYSTGGFQPAFGQVGTGFNSLYSSFQFLDVGVNVDLTPKVHGPDEVSLHIELDISNIRDRIDIGGILQPVVGQRKVVHDIRLKEGEVSLLGGLMQAQETKVVSGIPGLSSIPLIRRLFSSESIEISESELLIAIIPHVVRAPEYDESAYKGIASGSERIVHLSYAPRRVEMAAPAAAPKPAETAAPVPAAPAVTAPVQPQPETAAPAKPETAQPAAPPAPAPAKPEAQAGPGGLPAPMPLPVAAASVAFTPSTIEAQPGGTVTVNLQVNNITDLFDAPLQFKFDPNVLRLREITRGGFLSGDGKQVIFTRNILNDTGDASVNLGRMPGSGGVSGSGTLLTLTFQVVGKGTSTVAAPQVSLRNSQGQAVLAASPQVTIQVK